MGNLVPHREAAPTETSKASRTNWHGFYAQITGCFIEEFCLRLPRNGWRRA
jgi:hypothetical protein